MARIEVVGHDIHDNGEPRLVIAIYLTRPMNGTKLPPRALDLPNTTVHRGWWVHRMGRPFRWVHGKTAPPAAPSAPRPGESPAPRNVPGPPMRLWDTEGQGTPLPQPSEYDW